MEKRLSPADLLSKSRLLLLSIPIGDSSPQLRQIRLFSFSAAVFPAQEQSQPFPEWLAAQSAAHHLWQQHLANIKAPPPAKQTLFQAHTV